MESENNGYQSIQLFVFQFVQFQRETVVEHAQKRIEEKLKLPH
jgi:hypothetical protein